MTDMNIYINCLFVTIKMYNKYIEYEIQILIFGEYCWYWLFIMFIFFYDIYDCEIYIYDKLPMIDVATNSDHVFLL